MLCVKRVAEVALPFYGSEARKHTIADPNNQDMAVIGAIGINGPEMQGNYSINNVDKV